MDLNTPVSGRQFAKMVGQAESAVRKAKVRGSIIKGITSDGKYIPSIASNEWGKTILPEFGGLVKKNVSIKKPTSAKPIPDKKIPIPKKTKKDPETIEEFVAEIMHEKLPMAGADDLDDETVSEELDDKIQNPEAERITSVLKAKILQITYSEKKGQLVPIDKVNTVLFGYGQEIRNAFESIPDRIIDRILAVADKRHEARRILADEIQDTLELLADINNREF
jgi:phage terminase Nu1 subunit (DNA packaging protein)